MCFSVARYGRDHEVGDVVGELLRGSSRSRAVPAMDAVHGPEYLDRRKFWIEVFANGSLGLAANDELSEKPVVPIAFLDDHRLPFVAERSKVVNEQRHLDQVL